MKTFLIKTIAHTQPAIALATALAHVSLDLRWPATLALLVGLQVLALLATMRRRQFHPRELRFVARTMVPVEPRPAPARRRAHLSLVP